MLRLAAVVLLVAALRAQTPASETADACSGNKRSAWPEHAARIGLSISGSLPRSRLFESTSLSRFAAHVSSGPSKGWSGGCAAIGRPARPYPVLHPHA